MVRKDYFQLRHNDRALPDLCHPFRHELGADQNLGVRDAGELVHADRLELLADDVVAAGEPALTSRALIPKRGSKSFGPRLSPDQSDWLLALNPKTSGNTSSHPKGALWPASKLAPRRSTGP
jgi:hypothetical protein